MELGKVDHGRIDCSRRVRGTPWSSISLTCSSASPTRCPTGRPQSAVRPASPTPSSTSARPGRARPARPAARARRPRCLLLGNSIEHLVAMFACYKLRRRAAERQHALCRRRAGIPVQGRRCRSRCCTTRRAPTSGAGRRAMPGRSLHLCSRRPLVRKRDRRRITRSRPRTALPRRPVHPLHGRHDRHAQRCRVAPGGHLLRRTRRRESRRAADRRARTRSGSR